VRSCGPDGSKAFNILKYFFWFFIAGFPRLRRCLAAKNSKSFNNLPTKKFFLQKRDKRLPDLQSDFRRLTVSSFHIKETVKMEKYSFPQNGFSPRQFAKRNGIGVTKTYEEINTRSVGCPQVRITHDHYCWRRAGLAAALAEALVEEPLDTKHG
jgi:hypothetical protein